MNAAPTEPSRESKVKWLVRVFPKCFPCFSSRVFPSYPCVFFFFFYCRFVFLDRGCPFCFVFLLFFSVFFSLYFFYVSCFLLVFRVFFFSCSFIVRPFRSRVYLVRFHSPLSLCFSCIFLFFSPCLSFLCLFHFLCFPIFFFLIVFLPCYFRFHNFRFISVSSFVIFSHVFHFNFSFLPAISFPISFVSFVSLPSLFPILYVSLYSSFFHYYFLSHIIRFIYLSFLPFIIPFSYPSLSPLSPLILA